MNTRFSKTNIIETSWKGQRIIRSRPSVIAPSDSKLRKQHQGKFSSCLKFAKQIREDVIFKIWNPDAKRMPKKQRFDDSLTKSRRISGTNLFCSRNIQKFDEKLDFADQDKLIISYGQLPPIIDLKAEFMQDNPGQIKVSFTNNSYPGKIRKTDYLGVVVISGNEVNTFNMTEISRESGGGIINLPDISNNKVRLYLFFQSVDGKLFSNSSTVCLIT